MKHIKIFEEFTPDEKPEFESQKILSNDIRLIEMRSKKYLVTYFGSYYLQTNKIEKMPDGFWLVNGRVQCSSITDMIKVCKDIYTQASEWFLNEVKKMVSVTNKDGNIEFRYENSTDVMIQQNPMPKKWFYVDIDLFLNMSNMFKLDQYGCQEVMNSILEKYLETGPYHIEISKELNDK